MAYVIHNLLAIRSHPAFTAEMVNQAVYGEPVELLELSPPFVRVETAEGYQGWALSSHVAERPGASGAKTRIVIGIAVSIPSERNRTETNVTRLSLGSLVQLDEELSDSEFAAILLPAHMGAERGFVRWDYLSELPILRNPPMPTVMKYAAMLRGTPYVWGGTSGFGLDCSGFVQRVFRMAGLLLPRDAWQQAEWGGGTRTFGTPSAFDLVFFQSPDNRRGREITHVGIALDAERFIHAWGRAGVVISQFDDPDILTQYTRKGGLNTQIAP